MLNVKMSYRTLSLAALLLIAVFVSYNTTDAARGYRCCNSYSSIQKVKPELIKAYKKQDSNGVCNVEAVLLITRKGWEICADPRARKVKEIIRRLKTKENRSHGQKQ
nr:PREDICTED: C-C motif chemokine 20-like [Lepisosteus oculatus]